MSWKDYLPALTKSTQLGTVENAEKRLSTLSPFMDAVLHAAEHHYTYSNLNARNEQEEATFERAKRQFPDLIRVITEEIPSLAKSHKELKQLGDSLLFPSTDGEKIFYANKHLLLNLSCISIGNNMINVPNSHNIKGKLYDGKYKRESLLSYYNCPEQDVIDYLSDLAGYFIAQKLEPQQKRYLEANSVLRIPGHDK